MLYPSIGQPLLNLIKDASHVMIASHKRPDADCAYSSMALDLILRSMGKKTMMVNEGPFNRSEVLPCAASFYSSPTEDFLASDPLVVIVDCSDAQRVGTAFGAADLSKLKVVILDHHSSHDPDFGDAVYRIPESVSTTLIIYQLSKALGVTISKECAQYILRGFITDSGGFRFIDSKQNETFFLIAELTNAYGLCVSYEYEYIFSRQSMAVNRFLSKLMDRSRFFHEGRLAISFEYESDAAEYEGNPAPTDDYFARMFLVQGVQAVVMLRYLEPNRTNLSFRSSHRSGIDVGAIASEFPGKFNGGGHVHASGADVAMDMETALNAVVNSMNGCFN
ncbi:MAG: DHH family phosphoesterase [Sphaerochaetaceae bacterium]|nr:DHH family phosphoesterase [Sphaerochaetaceae bacterium]